MEEFSNHMLRFQQVTMTSNYFILTFHFQAGLPMIEMHFKQEPKPDEPETLRMGHFYFPLGMWFVGILISLFSFVAEIIIHRTRKSKTDVPMLPLEKPTGPQSTPWLEKEEVNRNTDVLLKHRLTTFCFDLHIWRKPWTQFKKQYLQILSKYVINVIVIKK